MSEPPPQLWAPTGSPLTPEETRVVCAFLEYLVWKLTLNYAQLYRVDHETPVGCVRHPADLRGLLYHTGESALALRYVDSGVQLRSRDKVRAYWAGHERRLQREREARAQAAEPGSTDVDYYDQYSRFERADAERGGAEDGD